MSLIAEKKVTRQQVIQPVVPMRQTDTYQPVQNGDFLDMLENVAESHGLELGEPQFGEARARQRMFGVYPVNGKNHFGEMVQLMLGVRNAFDGSISAGICFGAKVLVCSNLVFTGYAGEDGIAGKAFHRHVRKTLTPTLVPRLRDRIDAALYQVDNFIGLQNQFYTHLRDTKISEDRASETIIQAARRNVIPKKDILDISDEWLNPQHEDFKDRNAWSLFNAFTEQGKSYTDRNLVAGSQRLIDITEHFDLMFN